MIHRVTWLLLALLLWAAPVQAETDFVAPVVSRLEAEGFTINEVKRTWLGRILITATDSNGLREIVLNRHNGEILRDRMFPISDTAMMPQTGMPPDSSMGGNMGGNGGGMGNGGNGGGNGGGMGGGGDM